MMDVGQAGVRGRVSVIAQISARSIDLMGQSKLMNLKRLDDFYSTGQEALELPEQEGFNRRLHHLWCNLRSDWKSSKRARRRFVMADETVGRSVRRDFDLGFVLHRLGLD
jgi:hypothetical protein